MAARGVNKVILVGHLGADPEVRYMQNGTAVATLTLATSESWKDSHGVAKEKTEWHRVVIFGKLAEIAGEYLRKGSQVYFEGKLHTRKWQDQSGQDRYTTEVVIDIGGTMQMLGHKPDQSSNGQANNQPQNQATAQQYAPQNQYQAAPNQANQQRAQPARRPPPQGQNPPPPQAPQAQPNHYGHGNPPPPDDWDDDIPFARLGLQYPALMYCS